MTMSPRAAGKLSISVLTERTASLSRKMVDNACVWFEGYAKAASASKDRFSSRLTL